MDIIHAVSKDQISWAPQKRNIVDYLTYAVRKSGRGFIELALEYVKLNKGVGKITLREYVQYRMYETDQCTPEEQKRFITNDLHWPITHNCCDMSWQAVTEDKWLCAYFLKGTDIPVPQTLAIIDKTNRHYPQSLKINTVDKLRSFITSNNVLPCFGKEIRGICSFGAFVIEEATKDQLHLQNDGWMKYEKFFNDYIGSTPYIFQPVQTNHEFFDQKTQSLATIRICILMSDESIKIPFAVLKLPATDQLADSFWRPGNLACNLNPQTGEILTIRAKSDYETVDYEEHPETGCKMIGEVIPMWDKILNLVHTCSPLFYPIKYQSMDIALTPDGPVLIEINTGGGFDLPQLASGKGFLTDEVSAFFQECKDNKD